MTAATPRDLRVVPDQPVDADELPAPTCGLGPEVALLGACQWQEPATAARVLALVTDEDVEHPATRYGIALARRIAESGRRPDAVCLWDEASADGILADSARASALSALIMRAATDVPHKGRPADYAVAVLRAADRRTAGDLGHALAEHAATAPLNQLDQLMRDAYRTIRDRRRRLAELERISNQ
ncbi:hypothetical protein [Dietzia cinnamea]|uniref:hypothetical protein n=1 Tax=Dietzia cinnamea TaxID=321318 RepID=UPI0015E7FB93|nr:hypothetical protein [Dietzia cinnamea]MBM7231938.1 hypothetical protein [Dietzia cinnamea]MCT1641280.1 hypothetical protein [Dietzia cinnamea]